MLLVSLSMYVSYSLAMYVSYMLSIYVVWCAGVEVAAWVLGTEGAEGAQRALVRARARAEGAAYRGLSGSVCPCAVPCPCVCRFGACCALCVPVSG